METIRSRTNQKAKAIRKVRDRKIDGCFFVEGLRLTCELLNSNIEVLELVVAEDFASGHESVINSFLGKGIELVLLSRDVFDSVSETKSPQGIAAICSKPDTGIARFRETLTSPGKYVMLHGISNPGNLGTVLRTAEAFGIKGVILTMNSTDAFHPASVRGSMGSVFRIPIWTGAVFHEAVQEAARHGVRSIRVEASETNSVENVDWNGGRLIVFGSEATGLDVSEKALVEEGCSIPMKESVESLNLAVAAGIVLYTATHNR